MTRRKRREQQPSHESPAPILSTQTHANAPAAPPCATPAEPDRTAAFFAGSVRRGAWSVPPKLELNAVCGGILLDFTQAEFQTLDVSIELSCWMGGVKIIVPPGMAVESELRVIGGGVKLPAQLGDHDPAQPRLELTGSATLSGVAVEVAPRKPSPGPSGVVATKPRFPEPVLEWQSGPRRFWQRALLSVLGGCMVFLAFPRQDLWPLAYLGLVPLLLVIRDRGPWQALGWGALFGFVTNTGGFWWLSGMLRDFGHMHPVVAWLLCLLLTAYQGLVFAFWAGFVRWLGRWRPDLPTWLVAIPSFVAIEFVLPMLFPWYYGNGLHLFYPAMQVAELFGILGVSLLALLVNLALYEALQWALLRRAGQAQPFPVRFVATALALWLASLGYGVVRIAQVDARMEEARKLRIGLVEANIGIWEKEVLEKLDNNLLIHQHLSTELAQQDVDLVVWPESSYQSPLIWGSRLASDDLLLLESDALYVPRMRDRIVPALRLLERAFDRPLHRHPAVHRAFHSALGNAAPRLGFDPPPEDYPWICGERANTYLACPFRRVPPDDVSFLLPSAEALQATRRDDAKAGTLPWNQLAVQRGFHVPMLFGNVTIRAREGVDMPYERLLRASRKERDLYNVAHLLDADGRVLGNYKKVYLLLFGEKIPLADHIPWIYELIPEAGSFTAGTDVMVMPIDDARVGVMICYEDIIPSFNRNLSRLEPQIVINVTNDAWFGKTSEPYLHLALATTRAIETRTWLVRSTNTGVSAFIDANGRIRDESSLEDAETLVADVPVMPGTRTLYSYIGDILGWVGIWGMATLAVMALAAKRAWRREAV